MTGFHRRDAEDPENGDKLRETARPNPMVVPSVLCGKKDYPLKEWGMRALPRASYRGLCRRTGCRFHTPPLGCCADRPGKVVGTLVDLHTTPPASYTVIIPPCIDGRGDVRPAFWPITHTVEYRTIPPEVLPSARAASPPGRWRSVEVGLD